MSLPDSSKPLVVFSTTSNEAAAARLAQSIVNAGLAACVQIIPGIRSVYVWNGEVVTDGESLLLMKTTKGLYQELEKHILANHQYEIPEILAVSAENVFSGYLQWLINTVKSG